MRADLLQSLRSRQINHKFLYDSVKQAQKWLALHEAYSPSRTDPNGAEIYDLSLQAAAAACAEVALVHVIGLGCGGGQKETRLLQWLKQAGKAVAYTPCDVSTAMVLAAQQAALSTVSATDCHPSCVTLRRAMSWRRCSIRWPRRGRAAHHVFRDDAQF